MSAASHQITQRDVTFWGMAALVCGAVAVLAGNLGVMMPPAFAAQLHGTRLSSGSFQQVQALLEQTRQESAELSAANRALTSRFDLIDRSSTEMARRVAAVEQSVPLLIEALPFDADIDRSLLTAAIGGDAAALTEVEGGLLALNRVPMVSGQQPNQPLPPLADDTMAEAPSFGTALAPDGPAPTNLDPTTTASIATEGAAPASDAGEAVTGQSAVALGTSADAEAARAAWEALLARLGPLLLGLEPRIVEAEDGARLIAGPFGSRGAAQTLCDRLTAVAVTCAITDFGGTAL